MWGGGEGPAIGACTRARGGKRTDGFYKDFKALQVFFTWFTCATRKGEYRSSRGRLRAAHVGVCARVRLRWPRAFGCGDGGGREVCGHAVAPDRRR